MTTTKLNTAAFQHDKTKGHDEWLTPPEILQGLAPFDLDPCAPIVRPWEMAERHYTINDNGLHRKWDGFVWCNPPYGNDTRAWIQRLAEHNNGIALIFARTDTQTWQKDIFPKAHSILFIEGRLTFYTVDGKKGKDTAGAPSALVAYGAEADNRIRTYWRKRNHSGCYINLFNGRSQ